LRGICGSETGLDSAGITRSSGSWGGISDWSSVNVGVDGRDTVNLCHFGTKDIGAGVIKASIGVGAIKRYVRPTRYAKKGLGHNWGGYKRRSMGGIDASQNWRRIKRVRGINRGLKFVTIVGVMSVCDCPDPT